VASETSEVVGTSAGTAGDTVPVLWAGACTAAEDCLGSDSAEVSASELPSEQSVQARAAPSVPDTD